MSDAMTSFQLPIRDFRRFLGWLREDFPEVRWRLEVESGIVLGLEPVLSGDSGGAVADRLEILGQSGELRIGVRIGFEHMAQALLATSPGVTRTYRQIATQMGWKPQAARAVGRLVGTNPIFGIIPCHRVIRADGGIGGYRWGVEFKESLLRMERL